MSALARNDITYDSTRAARDDLRVSNWAPFQSPTNAAVFTKGSALGGFGLCWKRFCYADMLLVVPLVISLVYLKVPDCSRCHVSTFSMKTYENKAYIFSIVEKQMLRWWLWHLGVGTSCIRLHIVAKGNSYWFCSSTNMFCMLKFYSFLWSKTPYLSPAVVFFVNGGLSFETRQCMGQPLELQNVGLPNVEDDFRCNSGVWWIKNV